jgi:hypothetical protein
MPNPWLNEHKSTAAMNYFFNNQMFIRLHVGFILTDGNLKYVMYDLSNIGEFEVFPVCV